MTNEKARIISLVPSWTETLVAAQLNVVGRTRYCVHPADVVGTIPIVGGTKSIQLETLLELNPDLVVMDREENKKEVAADLKRAGINVLDSHVMDLKSAGDFLEVAGQLLKADGLIDMSRRYRRLDQNRLEIDSKKFFKLSILEGDFKIGDIGPIQYVIWKNPYMVIGENTFIADVLSCAGIRLNSAEKYPVISESDLKKSFCFFSSEPFPFAPLLSRLRSDGFQGCLVDGEKISWYGIRNLLFLEQCLK